MVNQEQIEKGVEMILSALGEDITRPGLRETPNRVARMYEEIFSGLKGDFTDYKLFPSDNQEMVLVSDLQFYSMCEHHLLPFFGNVQIAYFPKDGQVLGLSKFPRLVEYCAKRPSVQENLTVMIAEKLAQHVPNNGIAVSITAEHLCMQMRGIKTPHSTTTTFYYSGRFQEEKEKNEFLRAIGR